jgi:hypothetical protein
MAHSAAAEIILSYNLAVLKKNSPSPRQFEVGDKIRVTVHGGKIVDAVIKAILASPPPKSKPTY